MSTRELTQDPSLLREVRRTHPTAVGLGTILGFEHPTKAEITRMEKRREVVAYRRHARRLPGGRIEIPYVRLKERAQVRREAAIRLTAMLAGTGMFLASVAWLAWQSRHLIMLIGIVALCVTALIRFGGHWSRGCAGLHCAGCRG